MRLKLHVILILLFLSACASTPNENRLGLASANVFANYDAKVGDVLTLERDDFLLKMTLTPEQAIVIEQDVKVDVAGPGYLEFHNNDVLFMATNSRVGRVYCSTVNSFRSSIGTAVGRACAGDKNGDGALDVFYEFPVDQTTLSESLKFSTTNIILLGVSESVPSVPYRLITEPSELPTQEVGYRVDKFSEGHKRSWVRIEQVAENDKANWKKLDDKSVFVLTLAEGKSSSADLLFGQFQLIEVHETTVKIRILSLPPKDQPLNLVKVRQYF